MPRSQLEVNVPAWNGRRAAAALRQVKAAGRRERTPCVLCRQPIDYNLPSTDPDGCTVQHVKSRKLFPHLTWSPSNWAPAHKSCNSSAGTGENPMEPGVEFEDW